MSQQLEIRRYASDFLAFAADLHVPLGGSTGRLGDNWADFQQRDFTALAPSLLALARGEMPEKRRFWVERTKGGSKDSDCAVAILWLLAFSPRSLRIQVGAYDREQASELKLIIKQILAIDAPLNRLLATKIEVQQNRIIAHASTAGRTESLCEILTADAYGSHGSRPDVVIANELSHVGNQAFMETLFDNADKVPHSLVIVATNAGEIGTWQEKWREIAQQSDRWYVSVLDKPSPWISEADLAESRLRNPLHRFNRLWRGIWSTGEGEGLDPVDIEACTVLDEPPEFSHDCFYLGGIDLGLKNDHAAACVLAANPREGTVDLAALQSWRPEDFGGEIDLNVVQSSVLRLNKTWRVMAWIYDPWQCALLAQNLRLAGAVAFQQQFTTKRKDQMAKALLEGFRNRLFRLYPHPDLYRDLLRLRIKEGPVGYRLDAVKDENGHADRAIAFSIALPEALGAMSKWSVGQFDEPEDEQILMQA